MVSRKGEIQKDLVLHVWPGKNNMESIDVQCLAAILYLQLAIPGRFSIVEETNPDLSPSGQLPYLIHRTQAISPLSSILAYVSLLDAGSLAQDDDGHIVLTPFMDESMSATQKQQSVAWRAFVEMQLGDLVAHSFYSLYPNFQSFTRPMLASMLPFPQRFYVPDRLRAMQRPRLEAAMLWEEDKATRNQIVGRDSAPPDAQQSANEHIKRTFAKEKIIERVTPILDLLSRLTPTDSFIFGDRPATLDIILAAHILPLLYAPLPNPLLKTLLLESYPLLVSHACMVHSRASRGSVDGLDVRPPIINRHVSIPNTVKLLFEGLSRLTGPRTYFKKASIAPNPLKGNERMLQLGRWAWFSLAGMGCALYVYSMGLRIVIMETVDNEGVEEVVVEEGARS